MFFKWSEMCKRFLNVSTQQSSLQFCFKAWRNFIFLSVKFWFDQTQWKSSRRMVIAGWEEMHRKHLTTGKVWHSWLTQSGKVWHSWLTQSQRGRKICNVEAKQKNWKDNKLIQPLDNRLSPDHSAVICILTSLYLLQISLLNYGFKIFF